ncbi:MAG: spore germination protein GerW family protein [Candidatus Zixiibacteriota bacterium]
MANNVVEILNAVVGELKEMAKSETVVGKPITAGDKTLVPIITITVGFGAGGGQGESQKVGTGFGGGGGGGMKIEPSAFIILEKDSVSLLPAKRGSWENIIESIPGVIEKLGKAKASWTSKSEKPEEK